MAKYLSATFKDTLSDYNHVEIRALLVEACKRGELSAVTWGLELLDEACKEVPSHLTRQFVDEQKALVELDTANHAVLITLILSFYLNPPDSSPGTPRPRDDRRPSVQKNRPRVRGQALFGLLQGCDRGRAARRLAAPQANHA